MAEHEQVEPETGAEPLELDEYGRMVAAIAKRFPDSDYVVWRAHFTPAVNGRPCGAHLEVRENGAGVVGTFEAAGDTPDAAYAALRRLVEAEPFEDRMPA